VDEQPAIRDEWPDIVIGRRFCGPPASANGGYVSGRFASAIAPMDEPITVSLRQPPPLETPLIVVRRSDDYALMVGDALVADARPGDFRRDPVPPASLADAAAAHASYSGLDEHSFDGCFVCGPGRAPGDGLRLCPGLVGDGLTACVWTPDASLEDPESAGRAAVEFVWAALDCPGGWTSDLVSRPLVLGRMTATVERLPVIGSPVVIVGKLLETRGRKTLAAVTGYDRDGRIIGRAEQTWIEVDPAAFY
jgi:hypothetical protein